MFFFFFLLVGLQPLSGDIQWVKSFKWVKSCYAKYPKDSSWMDAYSPFYVVIIVVFDPSPNYFKFKSVCLLCFAKLIGLVEWKDYRAPLHLMVKTMVSCWFSLKPIWGLQAPSKPAQRRIYAVDFTEQSGQSTMRLLTASGPRGFFRATDHWNSLAWFGGKSVFFF